MCGLQVSSEMPYRGLASRLGVVSLVEEAAWLEVPGDVDAKMLRRWEVTIREWAGWGWGEVDLRSQA